MIFHTEYLINEKKNKKSALIWTRCWFRAVFQGIWHHSVRVCLEQQKFVENKIFFNTIQIFLSKSFGYLSRLKMDSANHCFEDIVNPLNTMISVRKGLLKSRSYLEKYIHMDPTPLEDLHFRCSYCAQSQAYYYRDVHRS